eukprot:TRINITY_DN13773_c0_g1_i1.p2 TRINITY_DN13773_c0_g1~~TRINITY_DN13773_c0_g1_i1.p2  ORF type:complete len:289 (-),score=41.37 TRINITY_DN13773_c0_g1_i1:1143-1940(-)
MALHLGINPADLHKFPDLYAQAPTYSIADNGKTDRDSDQDLLWSDEESVSDVRLPTSEESKSSSLTLTNEEHYVGEEDDAPSRKRERPATADLLPPAKRLKLSGSLPANVWDRAPLTKRSRFCLKIYLGDPRLEEMREKNPLPFAGVEALGRLTIAVYTVRKTSGETFFSNFCGHPDSYADESNKRYPARNRCPGFFKKCEPIVPNSKDIAVLENTLECNGSCWWCIPKGIFFVFKNTEGDIVAHTEFRRTMSKRESSATQKVQK